MLNATFSVIFKHCGLLPHQIQLSTTTSEGPVHGAVNGLQKSRLHTQVQELLKALKGPMNNTIGSTSSS